MLLTEGYRLFIALASLGQGGGWRKGGTEGEKGGEKREKYPSSLVCSASPLHFLPVLVTLSPHLAIWVTLLYPTTESSLSQLDPLFYGLALFLCRLREGCLLPPPPKLQDREGIKLHLGLCRCVNRFRSHQYLPQRCRGLSY